MQAETDSPTGVCEPVRRDRALTEIACHPQDRPGIQVILLRRAADVRHLADPAQETRALINGEDERAWSHPRVAHGRSVHDAQIAIPWNARTSTPSSQRAQICARPANLPVAFCRNPLISCFFFFGIRLV
jgi:hypothetical protein